MALAHLLMQLLEVGCEVMNTLGIQEFTDDVGGLQMPHGGHILGHGPVIVPPCMQVIPVPLLYLGNHACICLQASCVSQRKSSQSLSLMMAELISRQLSADCLCPVHNPLVQQS